MKTWIRMWCSFLTGAALMVTGSGLQAAEFSPALEYELEAAGAKDMVSAIVIFESPIDIRVLDDVLHMRQATRAERKKEVIQALRYNAESTQQKFRDEFDAAKDAGDVAGYTAYWIENLFVIQATREFIESLRGRGDIKYVTENFRAETIEPIRIPEKERSGRNPLDTMTLPPGVQAIGAYRVNTELGITGQGVLVANCDTGVDGNHPALSSRWRGNFAPWYHCWRDALGTNTQFPNDGNAHGTHVMGTITGRAIVGADTQWIGCAPDARWIATNSINQGVSQNFDNDIIADYQWFADPDTNENTLDDDPDVIQNSWGVFTGLGYAQCFDYWNTVILNCEATGTVITWSAGNESTSGLRSPAIYQLNDTQIFSVGAVDASSYPNGPYPLAGFSSQGPTPCQPNPGAIKPEISAPGVNVYSSVPGGGYNGGYSGTSMAGPHVAGCVALMRQACPNCDPTTIKNAIMNTAIDAGYGPAGPDNQFGAGFIDCYNAVLAVSNLGHLIGVVRDANNDPLAGVTVRNVAGLQVTQTNASGQYDLPLQEGIYSISYSKFGYVTEQVNGLEVTEGNNTTQDVTLQAAPQGTVSGTVTHCDGGPAVGATVEVMDTPVPAATTDGAGFYSITLPQGTYDTRAFGAGCGEVIVADVVIAASTTQDFTLPDDPRFQCSAPDGGGYIACENGDQGGPTFGWFEISPLAGGPGANTGLASDDQNINIPLPFTFRHYGADYTSINVCSNGFLSFNTSSIEWGNQSLPASTIGSAVVPFWDDLYLPSGGSDVSTYHLAAQNAFIVEWYNIQHFPGSDPRETFQVWLYNEIGPNGNGQVRLQYLTASSGVSTVGVQNGTIANLYQFNTTLDVNAQGLENNRAILYGESCQGVAELQISPTSIQANAPSGGSDSQILQICNIGTCPLSWGLSFTQITPVPGLWNPPATPLVVRLDDDFPVASKNESERAGRDQLDDFGGPDGFGYEWKDSNEPDGPTFGWFDIASLGTNVGLAFDDRCAAVALPWNIRFYGATYDTLFVCSNGNAQFTGPDTTWSNRPIPTSTTPNALLAVFWDDMNLETAGAIYYYYDVNNDRFIVQWDSVFKWTGSGPFWFQIILEECGNILYQYETMSGLLNSATVGIENPSGTDGLEVVYNAAYLTSNLAVAFTYPEAPWLSAISQTSGVLDGSECADITLDFNAVCLPAGTYDGTLILTSNDADENPLDIPVQFTVGSLSAPTELTIYYNPTTTTLDFRWLPAAGAAEYILLSGTGPDGPFETVEGTTAATQISIPFPASSKLFYVVVASEGNGAMSRPAIPVQRVGLK